MKIARIYLRVSTNEQSLKRQARIADDAKKQGYYVAKVYAEKASGAIMQRPALQEMIRDLQKGDVVIAERLDRISRLPLEDAEKLISAIKEKGAKISVPEILDLSQFEATNATAKVIAQSMQEMMLRVALVAAREDYEVRRERQKQGIAIAKEKGRYKGRKPDKQVHERIIEMRARGTSISRTSKLCGVSETTTKTVWKNYKKMLRESNSGQLDIFHKKVAKQ